MKRIVITLVSLAAVGALCQPAQAFFGLRRNVSVQKQVIVQRNVAVRQRAVSVQAVVQPVYAQAVVQRVYAQPIVQQVYAQPVVAAYSQAVCAQPVVAQPVCAQPVVGQQINAGCSAFFSR